MQSPPEAIEMKLMDLLETRSEDETAALARGLAGRLRRGDVLLLRGDLGAGKSVFARALIRALAGDAGLEVPSPTFTLVQTYDTSAGPVWHFDLYRLKGSADVYELGWEEALADTIAIVEWPERLADLTPPVHLEIGIEIGPSVRRIVLTPQGGDWPERLAGWKVEGTAGNA